MNIRQKAIYAGLAIRFDINSHYHAFFDCHIRQPYSTPLLYNIYCPRAVIRIAVSFMFGDDTPAGFPQRITEAFYAVVTPHTANILPFSAFANILPLILSRQHYHCQLMRLLLFSDAALRQRIDMVIVITRHASSFVYELVCR
jgi:hypothetical protein